MRFDPLLTTIPGSVVFSQSKAVSEGMVGKQAG